MRISVIVTEKEYAAIKKAAGMIPLSSYLRHLALCACNGERAAKEKKGQK